MGIGTLSCYRDVLEDYEKKMRDAESESHEGKRKAESVWYVFEKEQTRYQPKDGFIRRQV